ncbi:autotransporter assembly complex family protein [Arsukibacterium sp.]|uniref:autotransporter assembly complex protein TamA n=1 Tax=Arsukibacterium sp. TaxID=1977258 RepID=UPI00299D53EF|nr:autotransporter assembly complex family protein [Arsukibacterium sp.]MDX1677275.1 autotransporter assembly complex family protein [Arsukibacterium sp.]
MSLLRTLISIIFLTSFSIAAETELKIRGIKGDLAQNVDNHIARYDKADISGSLRFQMKLQQDIETALQALGYYQSEVEFTLSEKSGKTTLLVDVTAGPPTRISTADIQLSGDAADDPQFSELLKNQAPQAGDILHHGKYDSLKNELRSLALRRGYFDAEFSRSRLEVIPERNQANITLHFASGTRYKFGEVSFSGQQIRERWMQSLLPFQPGQPYLASKLGEFNQAMANTNWFSSISIEGQTEQITDYTLPIIVKLEPRQRNSVETGIGYSSEVGARLRLSWFKPWLNDRGHSLDSNLILSNAEQNIEGTYKMPLADAANDFYQFQYGYGVKDYTEQNEVRTKVSNLAAERHWLLANDWYRTASIRWLYEEATEFDKRNTSNILMPGLSFNRLRQSSGNMPKSADRLLLAVEVSDKSWGSDENFVRLRARAGWIGMRGNDHRFVTRADAGAVIGAALENLPPSLRFFAGGDNNLRGYGYESLPIQDSATDIAGGRYMATASVEYQYRVKGNWWLASFFDYGSAWNDSPDFKRGIGLGVRWGSPVGPVRLDFGYGLDSGERKAFHIHFALGPEL